METLKLDPMIWDKFPIQSNRGINPLVVIEEVMKGVFPWAKVGFYSAEDLDHRMRAEGYVVVTPAHWAYESEWNDNVALRYGLKVINGGLAWNEMFLCVRPKDLDAKRHAYTMQESEDRYAVAADAKAREIQTAVGVKTGSSSIETYSPIPPTAFGSEGNEDEAETDVTTNAGAAPKRGRPPK